MSVNKIKKITYLTSQMAEKRQVSRSSDGAVKITRKKRYQSGIEKDLQVDYSIQNLFEFKICRS